MILSAGRDQHCIGADKMNIKKIKTTAAIILILIMAACSVFAFTACTGKGPVGFWIVDKVTAGDVVMSGKDAESIGLNAVGTVKLQKSGKCERNMLGEESQGTWEQAEDGTLTITYGEKQTLTGSIDDKGVMTLTDPQGAEYILSK